MSANSSGKPQRTRKVNWRFLILLPLWVVVSFGISQVVVLYALLALRYLGVPFVFINEALLNTIVAAVVYSLSLVIALGVPWLMKKRYTGRKELGLSRLVSWFDIGLAPLSFLLYFMLTSILFYLAILLIPGFDSAQLQETGFTNLTQQHEYILAFATLVVVAPIAEEILFRGYLYGKLRNHSPVWLAIFITSVIFAAVHGQWNVAVDVFALSVILCVLREVTGSIWAGILLHMIKNGLAFYLLFINPTLLHIMGG